MNYQYTWLYWSLMLLAIWGVVYFLLKSKESKKEMLMMSIWTMPLGLTEPFFIPQYWNPPTLFNLAQTTGFDIESLIFSFAIGGIAAVIYEVIHITRHKEITLTHQSNPRHNIHALALLSAPILFFVLYFISELNPIYDSIIAMVVGGIFMLYCRWDLRKKVIVGAFLFTFLYFLYFLLLTGFSPGYVDAVWNLQDISGILLLGVPIEELLFAFGIGFLWSGLYEHVTWQKIKTN